MGDEGFLPLGLLMIPGQGPPFADAERAHIEAVLRRHFSLDEETAKSLMELAEQERRQAPAIAPPVAEQTEPAAAVSGMPGVDKLPPAAQRPEVLVGAAFAGSFLVARILKRIFD